ncbi:MAG: DUF932 domain-containing protein [Desulfobacteraceae bacterium]|nr:DUF932 domain-containing protein [Desulfobacteraceae bacterium]
MPTNLYDAHQQWASRPPDERFQSLETLQSFTNARKSSSIEAERVLKQVDLKVLPEGSIAVNGNSPPARLSHWAFGQLCYSVGAPAKYLRTLPAEMARDCLSNGVGKSSQRCKLLLRENYEDSDTQPQRTASAFTGPNYGRIWDADVVQQITEATKNSGWHPPPARSTSGSENSGLYASDRDMFIFMVNDENPVEIGNAKLGRGFFCWNSETGAASFGLTTFLYSYVCGNHIVWGAEEVREIRIIHKGDALDSFHHVALPRLNRFVENRACSDTVKETVSRAMSEPIASDLGKTLEWFKDKPFTKGEISNAWDAGIVEENDATTVWGMVQGVTAYARSLLYTNWRVNLERRAGSLLNL